MKREVKTNIRVERKGVCLALVQEFEKKIWRVYPDIEIVERGVL